VADDQEFLKRWSRRKTAARATTEATAPAELALPVPQADADPEASPSPEIDPETLPDIDSLDKDSDFSVFMQNGVPDALRSRALRKLWLSDPAFNVVDGLVEYGEDYANIAAIAEKVQSVYKVGKAMSKTDGDPKQDQTVDEASPEDDAVTGMEDVALVGNESGIEPVEDSTNAPQFERTTGSRAKD